MTFNLHPEYGLPDSLRERAVRLAKEDGVLNAAKELNLSPSSIYNWIKKANQED
jgi:transposase-like protein